MGHVEDALERALSATEEVPDDLRSAAFREVLRFELGANAAQPLANGSQDAGAQQTARSPGVGIVGSHSDVETWEQKILSQCPEPHQALDGTRDQQIAWAVIQLRARGEEGSVEAVREAIETAGETPPNRSYTSRRLRELTRAGHLRRQDRPEGQGYAYLPSRRTLEIFDEDDS